MSDQSASSALLALSTGFASLIREVAPSLVSIQIACGLSFALATGHGQEDIDPRYRAQTTLRKPVRFAIFHRAIDDCIAPSGPGGGMRSRPALS
jgi:hypothetical protein